METRRWCVRAFILVGYVQLSVFQCIYSLCARCFTAAFWLFNKDSKSSIARSVSHSRRQQLLALGLRQNTCWWPWVSTFQYAACAKAYMHTHNDSIPCHSIPQMQKWWLQHVNIRSEVPHDYKSSAIGANEYFLGLTACYTHESANFVVIIHSNTCMDTYLHSGIPVIFLCSSKWEAINQLLNFHLRDVEVTLLLCKHANASYLKIIRRHALIDRREPRSIKWMKIYHAECSDEVAQHIPLLQAPWAWTKLCAKSWASSCLVEEVCKTMLPHLAKIRILLLIFMCVCTRQYSLDTFS